MNEYTGTKFEHDVGLMNCGNFIKTLSKKSIITWESEHNERLAISTLIMKAMGIKKRIYEFHTADIIQGRRIKTFSDYLNDNKHESTIVSKGLEIGNFNGINMLKSNKYFDNLYEYVTYHDLRYINNKESKTASDKLSYDVIDSIIFDEFHHRIEYYLSTALALGIDCYFPIIGYSDSEGVSRSLAKLEILKKQIININNLCTEELESNDKGNNSFIKIVKMSK